ncbi:MAG TPA: class I SAM-dependent RNA methyltransferase [Thermodesulfovibrionales bacterium]|jgi:23S rRNA (uracil1939-C5)-methyltransferase|nr:class I SAM-dependent RNA methyltransferase [Thermodesulfovibrionales bacterium]
MLQTVKAESPVYGGYAIARDGKVIFIKGAIPGELVEVSIDERKKDYLLASVRNVLDPSSFRREPPCKIFSLCGGCQLQFMEYERQVSIKEEIILDTMRRIGGLDIQLMPSLVDREFRYRHRCQFKVSSKGEIGYFREGTRDVMPVDECPVVVDEINVLLRKLNTLDLRGLKEVHVIAGDTIALLIRGNLSEDLTGQLMEIGVSGIAFDNGQSLGKDYITLDLNGLQYSVTPWSFFQSHWALNRKVVETFVNRLASLEDKRVLDLYAGAGNFSLPLSMTAKEVRAVEENCYAVEDGKRNAMMNGIKNCTFLHAPVGDALTTGNRQKAAKLFGDSPFDVVVLDPPRPGLSSDALKKVVEMGSEKVVYVSCNPATLARDTKKMRERYDLESLCLIDFFPNTYHVEALAVLGRK